MARSISNPALFRFLRALYDIKATDMGSQSVMFKAEVDMDGREITRSYLERIDIQLILQVRILCWDMLNLSSMIGRKLKKSKQ